MEQLIKHKRFSKKLTGSPRRHSSRTGRSQKLIRRRNLKLLLRFYQLTEVQRRRFDDVVRILSTEEFFISEQRVWWIVKRNLDILDKIKAGEVVELSVDPEDKDQVKLFDDTDEKD